MRWFSLFIGVVLCQWLAADPGWAAAPELSETSDPARPNRALCPDMERLPQAKELHAQGRELYATERYQEALGYFKRAHELCPNAIILFNMARSHDRLGGAGPARSLYQRFIDTDNAAAELSPQRKYAFKRLQALSGTGAAPHSQQSPSLPRVPLVSTLVRPGVVLASLGASGIGAAVGLNELLAAEGRTFESTTDEVTKRTARDQAQLLAGGTIASLVAGSACLVTGMILIASGIRRARGRKMLPALKVGPSAAGGLALGWLRF